MPRERNQECPSVFLLEVRERLIVALRRKINIAMGTANTESQQTCITRRKDIEKKWLALDENWMAIELGEAFIVELDRTALYNELLDLEEDTSTAYIHLGEISERRRSLTPPNNEQRQYCRLPQISITKFDGTPENWMAFNSLFQSVLKENEGMDDTQKMQTLMSVLEEEPAKLIRNIPYTDGNFDVAWTTLEQKYFKRRKLIDKQIDYLLDHPTILAKSSASITAVIDRLNESMNVLSLLKVKTDYWFPIVTRIVIRKMDTDLRGSFEDSFEGSNDVPTIDLLKKFLDTRSRVAENYVNEPKQNIKYYKESSATEPSTQYKTRNYLACIVCNQKHSIYKCQTFRAMDMKTKVDIILQRKLCTNCLNQTHTITKCESKHVCKSCGDKHSDFLHEHFEKQKKVLHANKGNEDDGSDPEFDYESDADGVEPRKCMHIRDTLKSEVLLSTAMVPLKAQNGDTIVVRAILDNGSQVDAISEHALQLLKRPRYPVNVPLGSVCNQHDTFRSAAEIEISSLISDNFKLKINALVLPKVAHVSETCALKPEWSHLTNLNLADPSFNKKGRIDLLLGAASHARIILEGLRKGKNDEPIAQLTQFGWALSGLTDVQLSKNALHLHKVSNEAIDEANSLL